jgi:murein DD-endopeptidase MepM/ murein hydrolase activator NlpD
VTQDLSWHPHKYAPKGRNSALLWLLTALLIAINVAVFLYHGDPRRLMAPKTPPPTPADAPAKVGLDGQPRRLGAGGPTGLGPRGPRGPAVGARMGRALEGLFVRVAHAHEPPPVAAAAVVGPAYPVDPLMALRSPGLVQRVEVVQMRDRGTASHALSDGGVRPKDVRAAVAALGRAVDLHRLRASDVFKMRFDGSGQLMSLELARGPLERILVSREDNVFVATKQAIAVDTLVAEVVGEVTTTLWDSLVGVGEDPRLVTQLVDIFAFEVDFYSEVRQGDTFRLLIQKRYVRDQFIGYGDILAAELTTGTEVHRAFMYKHNGRSEYFDEAGAAMRKQLLRTPLQYGTVTSHFGRRRHPILGYTRAHNGVDYGVPIGTPVWSVGDGIVQRAHFSPGFGQVVEVRHPNGWLSQYAHLSKIMVRKGQKVRQKDIVGLVGMTGLATGPHLHYGLKKNNHYVNSLAQHFDRATGLGGDDLVAFKKQSQQLVADLGKIRVAGHLDSGPTAPHKG